MASFIEAVRKAFQEHEELTLDDLYGILTKNHRFDFSESVIRHRIRSCLHSMKKNNEITRIRYSVYKKTR